MNSIDTLALLKEIEDTKVKKKMLLHACCAPCSSGCIPKLDKYFDITVLYYNPNIYPEDEFKLRYKMLEELNKHMKFTLVDIPYNELEYLERVKGHENDKERGERCKICFNLRMDYAAKYAKENNFDIFTTTLSISPYKDAKLLNEIGNSLEEKYGIKYFYSDFKKKDGYKESIRMSKALNLYRQEYCGCRYSINKDTLKEHKNE